ncbi:MULTISPECIES: DUF1570 domain-containing protein [unclassified Schlesneria]|uniref:DUF1570 domain-containing protein n=1 Tax=Schlesneria TaxID=656899 RepID=UPI002EE13079
MRYAPLTMCLVFLAAASVTAAPWSRLTSSISRRLGQDRSTASRWVEERDLDPYLIRSEFPLGDVQELVADLGDLQADLESILRLECEPRPIQVYLFSSKRSYDQYLRIRVPEGVNRQALYVPGTDAGRVYAYRQSELDIDVRHETTHALLHNALPYVPIWIDEGLAEYFEVPAASRVKGHRHRKELRDAIRFSRWKPNIEGLEAKRKLMDMNANDYRDSWGIVHFMLHGPAEAREALYTYFEEIQSGAAPTPLSQHLKQRIPNLSQAIIDHLK